MQAATNADELSLVVLAGQLGRLDAPGQGAASTGDLVGCDLLAVAASAEDDAQASFVSYYSLGCFDAEGRVVIHGVVLVSTAVDGLVAVRFQVFDDLVLTFESGMVGTQVYAHADNSLRPSRHCAPGPILVQMYPQQGRVLPGNSLVRHPWEIPLLVLAVLTTVVTYVVALVLISTGSLSTWIFIVLAAPILLFFARGQLYGSQQVNGIKMSPTQFPDGYQLVAEAAARFGMKTPPDAYVVLGNGKINAFASGHGFRRFVVVYSDLFEVGGQARQPDALAFIIGHEVGHIAAGHASYWRQWGQFASNYIPVIGSSLSRSMEYTADNFGFHMRPQGAAGAMGVLGAGKYLVGLVGFDELADRATLESGFFPWFVNILASHPVLTWRAAALRNRTRSGHLFFRPSQIFRFEPVRTSQSN